jgi:hypothetical protein
MEFDFAVIYWGLTRTTKHVYKSHIERIFNTLKKNNLTYQTFMHTWQLKDDIQTVWENIIPQKIDYSEYKLLEPAVYKIEQQEDFIESLNMDDFFYKDVWDKKGHCGEGEWLPGLIKNHLCALESMKRGLELVESAMQVGNKYKYIMFVRPDCWIQNELPLYQILPHLDKINIPNRDHNEGYNDRFAIMNYSNAVLYGKRINEIAEFRKENGRIVSEKYLKFIINKYNIPVNLIHFKFDIIRP